MKKILMTAAVGVMLAGLTGCKQNDEPQYQDPTSFTVNTPGLQNQLLETSDDMTDPATFNLFCSQPDYGYSAVVNYTALVSLDPTVPSDEESIAAGKSIELENQTPTSGAMALKVYDLAIAANKMAGITSEDQYAVSDFAKGPVKLYFRALAKISNVESSRIVSENVVSMNNVNVVYAVLKPGWIYICGDVQTADGSVSQKNGAGFQDPTPANAAEYENFKLWEPVEQAGQKLYVGQFNMIPKENGSEESNPDAASQFRFFTELKGWGTATSLGSHSDDFYCLPITNEVRQGLFQGDIVAQGLGNWGIHCTAPQPVTIVVDVTGLNIYVELGLKNVTFNGRTPQFN